MELVTWTDHSTAEQIARELNGGATVEDVLSRYDAEHGERGMILPRLGSEGVARARSGTWVPVPAAFNTLCYVARRQFTAPSIAGEFNEGLHRAAWRAGYFYVDDYGKMQFTARAYTDYDRICERLRSL